MRLFKRKPKLNIEGIAGAKLDPNAKYLIMYAPWALRKVDIDFLHDALVRLIGPNFLLVESVAPQDALKIYELGPMQGKVAK